MANVSILEDGVRAERTMFRAPDYLYLRSPFHRLLERTGHLKHRLPAGAM
jgi:hypothetical protein